MELTYKIVIPSLGRPTICRTKTIQTLLENGIPDQTISVYIVAEEEQQYRDALKDTSCNIVIGQLGLSNQRNFIQLQHPEGTNLVYMDDDIDSVDLSLSPKFKDTKLDTFLTTAFQECRDNNTFIWSVYPCFNPYFRSNRDEVTEYATFLIGAFYGIINRHSILLEPTDCYKEDVKRSIQYFLKDGKVRRYNKIGFKTKYYNNVGGLGNFKSRIDKARVAAERLVEKYPDMGRIKVRKNGMTEFVIKPLPPFETNLPPPRILELSAIDPSEFDELYKLLNKISIGYKNGENNRRGFPKHRAQVFGYTRQRLTGKFGLSSYTLKHPEIYQEMLKIGNKHCPIPFNSIHLNHKVTCPKHKDSNNVGESVLLSFGEYTGGNIVIEGKTYDAKYRPILFDGGKLEHWNTPDLEGNKYSLVFFTTKIPNKK